MKTLIMHYSHTGNNKLFAEEVAARLDADLFRIEESRTRTNKDIVLDMILGRKPAVRDLPDNLADYSLVVFFSPVWMFHVPAPLRSCMSRMKSFNGKYAFISLSGGALGPNTKIAGELKKRMGKKLALCLDLNSVHFCSLGDAVSVSDTGTYLLKDHPDDLQTLAGLVVPALAGLGAGLKTEAENRR